MLVPDFIYNDKNLNTSKRNLMTLSQIDVTRDILDFKLIRRNTETEVNLAFYMSLTEWEET